MKYTVHQPGTHMKVAEYRHLAGAFRRAYRFLPIGGPGRYNPEGKYVTVQEWDDASNPLRQWIISGRQEETA